MVEKIAAIEPVTQVRMFDKKELSVGKILGKGSFKTAIKCDWNGTPVVKMLFHLESQDDGAALRNFREEVGVVAKLVHPNIVQFLGMVKNEMAFVIAHMSNGSLFDVLFQPSCKAIRDQLTEAHRFKIALGVARAVNFLHKSVPPLVFSLLGALVMWWHSRYFHVK